LRVPDKTPGHGRFSLRAGRRSGSFGRDTQTILMPVRNRPALGHPSDIIRSCPNRLHPRPAIRSSVNLLVLTAPLLPLGSHRTGTHPLTPDQSGERTSLRHGPVADGDAHAHAADRCRLRDPGRGRDGGRGAWLYGKALTTTLLVGIAVVALGVTIRAVEQGQP
jgi:hypothetical protein